MELYMQYCIFNNLNQKTCLLLAFAAILSVGCTQKNVQTTDQEQATAQKPPEDPPRDEVVPCEKGLWDPATQRCVDCLSSKDCKNPRRPVCSENACVSCDDSHACDTGKCNIKTGKCMECMSDNDCTLRQKGVCWQGVCSTCSTKNCSLECNDFTGKCGDPVVLPCPGGNCGAPSPTTIEDIAPETLALINNIRLLNVAVQDLNKGEKPTQIQSYKVDARVNGMFAEVSTEFTIYNPNQRVFEGELEFPLPDGAVISGYAIDVNGIMVDGAVVEKDKARIAFENEVKRGVDPGLVEQIKGNAYRTRIYPINGRGKRQIRVVYTTPLAIAPNGDAALALPMPKTKLSQRDITISVASGMPAPAVGGLGDKRFESAEAVWRVESHDTNVTPKENILVAMPALPDVITAIEADKGDIFFSASVKTAEAQPPAMPAMPNKWRIIWDASGSRTPDDIAVARKLIDSLPESATYELHVFRNALEPVQTLNSRTELITKLNSLPYDGSTDFAPLEAIAKQNFDGPTLFFTDGIDTMTGALPDFGTSSVALISGAAHDIPSMRHICGGHTINLDIINGEEAVKQILLPQPVVSAVKGEGLSNIQGIGIPATGRITVVGRMTEINPNATILLSDGRQIPVTFNTNNVPGGRTIASAWAARRVDELSPRADDNREELLALGRRFSIVSPVTSLIVFERLDQWLRYDIEPPESLHHLNVQWHALRRSESQRQEDRVFAEKNWLRDLTYEWNERLNWWNNPIPNNNNNKNQDPFDEEEPMAEAEEAPAQEPAEEESDLMAALSGHRRNPNPNQQQGLLLESTPMTSMLDANSAIDLDNLDWSSFDVNVNAATAGYGLGATGAGGGGAGLGGFAAGGFGPGGGGGGGAIRSASLGLSSSMARSSADISGGLPGRHANQNNYAAASIMIKAWDPKTPYLQAIKDAYTVYKTSESLYAEYLRQREKYAPSPAFFLDCANLFFREKQPQLAVRILSNLSELKIDDVAVLRIYAWRLREAGEYDTAIMILRKVAKLRGDEVTSWRELALTLTMRGKQNHSAADIQEALELFHKAAFTPWERNDAVWTAVIALEELNELIAWTNRQQWNENAPVIPRFENKFAKNLDTDLRIMISWDADDTDIDMHVITPSGEKIYYAHQRSSTGAFLSHDVTRGYGPEEFLHKVAPKGTYEVITHYFASHQQKLVGPATITITFYTNWGRPEQKSETMCLRLDNARDRNAIGKFNVE